MEHIDTIRALRARLAPLRAGGARVALVPTMGALHAGHLSLVKEARQRAEAVVVSIFVNPTQFDDPSDLAKYPRTLDADLAACRDAGVDFVFCPTAQEMYPDGADTSVTVGALAEPLCGATRPGHFRGVATVVAKLLGAVAPQVAVFGEKDFQQLAVIRRMARDLLLDVEIVGAPTVREPDGLALSSRNAYLSKEHRAVARGLSAGLFRARRAWADGERHPERLETLARDPLLAYDYCACVDPLSFRPRGPLLIAAVRLGTTRLIDNLRLDLPDSTEC